MEPSKFIDGKFEAMANAIILHIASMEPSKFIDGKVFKLCRVNVPDGASMEPSKFIDGKTFQPCAVASTESCFNGAVEVHRRKVQ